MEDITELYHSGRGQAVPSQNDFAIKIFVVVILTGIVLISSVSAGALIHHNIDMWQSSTNKEILLPKDGSTSFKISSDNLILLITHQGNISPYYTVNPILLDKPDWEKQNFSLAIAFPSKIESISFGLYDKNMAASCCGGKPFMGRTDFIY